MTYTDAIGYIAAFLTTCSFMPQAYLTWKLKRAEGISTGMYSILVAGISLWLYYGILLNAWPIIIANAITLLLAVFILSMKLKYK